MSDLSTSASSPDPATSTPAESDSSSSHGRSLRRKILTLLPGLAAVASVAVVAVPLGQRVPLVGAPVIAILIGVTLSSIHPLDQRYTPGIRLTSKRVLQWSVIALGTGLSLREVISVGAASFPVLAGTLSVAFLGAVVVGHILGISRDCRTLIGVGTAICGASAIAAVDSVIGAAAVDVSYSVATIFTFNVIAVLVFPSLGHLFGMSQHAFGLWAGTAVNDTSSVVAASTIFGHAARNYAVVVKLTRTLMIVPITAVAAALYSRRSSLQSSRRTRREVLRAAPWFIVWFVVAVGLNTLGVIPNGWHPALSEAATVMITASLGAIGLSTRVGSLRGVGLRPLLFGALLWFSVAGTSIAIQVATGRL